MFFIWSGLSISYLQPLGQFENSLKNLNIHKLEFLIGSYNMASINLLYYYYNTFILLLYVLHRPLIQIHQLCLTFLGEMPLSLSNS